MSKIICDVCGTSYPDTANQCPICGCARADIVDPAPQNATDEIPGGGTYTYVKGGRFSKANVRKRNLARQLPSDEPQLEVPEEAEQKNNGGKGLVITAVVLLLAIIAVVIYIAVRFLSPAATLGNDQTQPTGTTAETTEATELLIACTNLKLSSAVIEFDKVGAAELLDVTPVPADTTDEILFASEDESVATVTANGKVTAVGPGQTVITITCGDVNVECRVVCTMEMEPTEETTQPTEALQTDFKLNREDFSLFAVGESWNLYNGDVSQDEIVWTTGDETIATVDKGIVKAVAPGYTTITAEYQGVKYNCIVRCQFTAVEADPSEPTTVTEGNTDGKVYTISHTDVTIAVGESFTLTLRDEDGNTASVSWMYDTGVCSVSGNTVTGAAKGYTKVSTFYNNVAYECKVYVKAASR